MPASAPPEAGITGQDVGTDAREDTLVHQAPFGFRGNLKLISRDKRYEPSFFTYEGLRRCGKDGCRQLWGIYQHRCAEPVGLCFARCDECWMPIPGGAAGRAQLQRHAPACRGHSARAAWEPAWDGTLHCPLCGCPGFAIDKMKRHVSACDGERRSVLGGGSVPTGNDPRSLRKCDDCEFTFHPSVFAAHVCGSTYDPVWLGESGVPDMTRPYVVWCSDGPGPYGPCGYGGGFIGDDPGGRIPEGVCDASWAVPFSTNPRYALGPPSTLFDLVRDLRRLLARVQVGPDDGADEDEDDLEAGLDQEYVDRLVAEVGMMDLGEKIARIREECATLRGRLNARTLGDNNIRPKKVEAGPCQGVGWRHGFIPCRSGVAINLETVTLEARESSGKVSWALVCPECRWLQSAIHAWVTRGKYNADGTRLCPVDSCREPVSNGVECEAHAALRSARRVEAKKARLGTWEGTKRRRVWDIVSPGDMKSFFGAVQRLPTPPWSRDQTWSRVADAVADKPPVPDVFLVDTETVIVSHTPKPLELSVLRANGEHMYTTTVDYGVDVADLCLGVGQQLLGYAIGIYRREGANLAHGRHPTHGHTPAAIASRLHEIGLGLGSGSVLVEWSENGWDWRAIRSLCGEASVPGEYLRGEDLLRLCGYRGPMDLETLYYLCFPDCPLHRRHHRAAWDVRKLHRVLCYVLAPSRAHEVVPGQAELDPGPAGDASPSRGTGSAQGNARFDN